MEIEHIFKLNHPNPTMLNKLTKLLPLIVLAIATPSFAAGNHSSHHRSHGDLAVGEMGRHLSDLNLTPEQKAKMEQLRAAMKTQIDAVLTPTQRQQRDRITAQRQANRQGENGLNLTADQKAKLTAIRDANKAQFKAILTPAQQAQIAQGGGWRRGGIDKLNLTAEQTAKMEQLRASARSQMDAILTPEQQQQANTRRERRQSMVDSWKSMNLTADQKAKIETIRQSSEQQFNAILTPEQQAKLKSHKQGGRNKYG
jgi:periplasmic protein CpxP/Spy